MPTYSGVTYHRCGCCHDRVSGRRLFAGPNYWLPERYFSGRDWPETDSPHFYTRRDVERAIRVLQREGPSATVVRGRGVEGSSAMYITVMWLRSILTGEQGENVVLYRHAGKLPHGGSLDRIVEAPGHKSDALRYSELTPGRNRIQAVLDVAFDDANYDRNAIDIALARVEAGINGAVTDRLYFDQPLGGGRMLVSFEIRLGPMDSRSAQAIFFMLRQKLGSVLTAKEKAWGLSA